MKTLLLSALTLMLSTVLYAKDYQLKSPDGNIQIKINTKPTLHFSMRQGGEVLIPNTVVSMTLENGKVLAKGDKVRRSKETSVHTVIHPVVAVKNSLIPDHYNQLVLRFKGRYKVVFRAYNDAIAYRFVTDFKDSVIIKTEQCDITFPKNASAWFSLVDGKDNVGDRWMNEYQHVYDKKPFNELDADERTELPLLVDLNKNGKVLITESNLHDYPGLYFKKNGVSSLQSIFPPRVKSERKNKKGTRGWDRTIHPASVYDYIAKTTGERTYPWRIFAIADKDVDLLNNEIVYKLADPNRIENTDWIQPGQVAWDWWNAWNITGVDFEAGINTKTYKYYIDFAARNAIPYIIMDDGWYVLGDLTDVVPEIDMPEILRYAKKKDVGIILWCSWHTLDKQMKEALDLYESWGIKGIKVDFMRRDDQGVVDFYWRCAKAAAERHLLVDFHGSHKPTGLYRTYPNVVNNESVAGMENDKWTDKDATPKMAVSLPYIRMFTGPMDYTPGAMRNAQKAEFRAIFDYPMSQGTRCQQLAMYVLYDSPLQMLSDNPTIYEKNKESLHFITSVPTTWDKTIPLQGKVGEYVAMARKHGKEYFVGAMTNWDARDLSIDFSFLPEGNWKIVIFKDGKNADRNGIDYKKVVQTVNNESVLNIHLAPGGGWAARIYR